MLDCQLSFFQRVSMLPAPPAFDGALSNFFETYVLPNAPSVERVQEFDHRLRRYLETLDPVHPIRMVSGQKRGVVCRSNSGWRMLPTDNSPVWWVHAFLLSEDVFPKNDAELFEELPCHLFRLRKDRTYLNAAGYHAAHLIDAKNGNTNWETWSREEIGRRSLLNIHPCNMVLVAKTDWRFWGGRADVLAWVRYHYQMRYGALMTSFYSDVTETHSVDSIPEDIRYHYQAQRQRRTQKTVRSLKVPSVLAGTLLLNRPIIKKELIGSDTELSISIDETRYLIPHDRLVEWVGTNTSAMKTRSWLEGGLYSWPRPTRAMAAFLKEYEV